MDFLYKDKFKYMVLMTNRLILFMCCISIMACLTSPVNKPFIKIDSESIPIARDETLIVKNINGSIIVDSWDKDSLKIIIRKIVYTHSQLEAESLYNRIKIEIIKKRNCIVIIPKFYHKHAAADLHFFLPKEFNLSIHNINGKIKVDGVRGVMDISASNGEITCTRISGALNVNTGNGDIILSNASGRISAITSNADISCSIEMLDESSISKFETANGDITLSIPDDLQPSIYGQTSNGEIESEFPIYTKKRDIENKEGVKVYAISANGNITITRRK
ncbi:MAG: DUF4097 family beta strand repeat-containing protein [candidate division WOR-3 bacterium]